MSAATATAALAETQAVLFRRIPGSGGTAEGAADRYDEIRVSLDALRAVVNSIEQIHHESTYGGWCSADLKTWPCPTSDALADTEVSA